MVWKVKGGLESFGNLLWNLDWDNEIIQNK
jgi:hypothetical protein